MTDDRIKNMIEARVKQEGLTVDEWREGEDGLEAMLGYYRVIEEAVEDQPPYLDAEGQLTACVVGSLEKNNERVYFTFIEDGMDGGDEVRDLSTLEQIS